MKVAILFDLDGTLLDTLGDLHAAVNHVLAQRGYGPRTLEEIRCFVGNGAERLIRLAAPEGADVPAILADFQTYYTANCNVLTGPYAGIPQALERLGKQYPLAVVSNKPDRAVKELGRIYFPGLLAMGEHAGCSRKPAPDMVFKAMEAIGADRCVYVGDSDVDILTARNAGVSCLSVTWGFRHADELMAAGATDLCDSPDLLDACIRRIIDQWKE